MEKHVGIMLYFDNFHRVESLPDDQLGLLFRALMACGEAELAGRDGITGFETRYPAMGERTQMAFAFMALRRPPPGGRPPRGAGGGPGPGPVIAPAAAGGRRTRRPRPAGRPGAAGGADKGDQARKS